MIKRFLVFQGRMNHAIGGFKDYRGSYNTFENAYQAVELTKHPNGFVEWAHIVDTYTLQAWSVFKERPREKPRLSLVTDLDYPAVEWR